MAKTILHQLKTDGTLLDGMSYVIQCSDGSLVVIDGAMDEDAETLYPYLCKLCGDQEPVVDAWFITHAHPDHTYCCKEVANRYADRITVKKLVYRFPDEEYLVENEPDCLKQIPAFETAVAAFHAEHVIPQAGDRFVLGDTVFEMLLTCADLPSVREVRRQNLNDTSLVFRMLAEGQRVLFLGDVQKMGNDILIARYGNDLKSDVCQVAHHGHFSSTAEFYDVVDPRILLWPASERTFQYVTGVVWPSRHLLEELHVEDMYLADDGTVALELPIAVRKAPYVPKLPSRYREVKADFEIPKAPESFCWQNHGDKAWEACSPIRGGYFYKNQEDCDCFVRLLWSEKALYFHIELLRSLPPSCPENVGTGNSHNVRLFLTEDAVTDVFWFWDQCPKEGSLHYLKLYPDPKNMKGNLSQCNQEDFHSYCFDVREDKMSLSLALPFAREHQSGDCIGVNAMVSVANREGTGRLAVYMLSDCERAALSELYPSALPIGRLI